MTTLPPAGVRTAETPTTKTPTAETSVVATSVAGASSAETSKESYRVGRRGFLRGSAGISAALVTGPAVLSWLANPQSAAAATAVKSGAAAGAKSAAPASFVGFVNSYRTNTLDNLTPETNAVVRVLNGMQRVWKTGATWDTGTPLMPDVLRDNMRYCARVTSARTEEQARQAFIHDRQDQSYAAIGGLGPLAELYRTGAKAVTSITTAPDGIPAGKINDAVPAGAPAGSSTGAGSVSSDLGKVVELVNTVRGPFASSNPGKISYQYPRPWRMTVDSEVVPTGATDELGYPVYRSDVIVVKQLLRQRGTTPAEDGGYPSGHTNAFYLASLALAYAIPERFQELVARASELSHTRIVAGMHSTVDVISGRVMATALAAATLADPANTALKSAARRQAASYFRTRTGSTADTLFAYAHSAGPDTDPYADREANAAAVTPRLTYVLPRRGASKDMVVPEGAEVLLETRLPYLDADQRREVLRTTSLPSGYVLLDGSELWGRLNLFAAADGFGAFDREVRVTMNAANGGFEAADSWRNDIDGRGGLTKSGTGTLTLTGANRYKGGTLVQEGTLAAGSPHALGHGDVRVRGGALRLTSTEGPVEVRGDYAQSAGSTLEVTPRTTGGRGGRPTRDPALAVRREAVIGRGSALVIQPDDAHAPARGTTVTVPVINARTLRGRFDTITVRGEGYRAEPVYTGGGLSVRLTRR
ncbi:MULTISPECIES: phosphatase PAP2 family protein [unclassified Streptomyces]|uniref:phosphatase PAP2 family protein n=1 Tax=unclassified Streptomyces TaxID=2593676 RepID=UPI0037FFCB6E